MQVGDVVGHVVRLTEINEVLVVERQEEEVGVGTLAVADLVLVQRLLNVRKGVGAVHDRLLLSPILGGREPCREGAVERVLPRLGVQVGLHAAFSLHLKQRTQLCLTVRIKRSHHLGDVPAVLKRFHQCISF